MLSAGLTASAPWLHSPLPTERCSSSWRIGSTALWFGSGSWDFWAVSSDTYYTNPSIKEPAKKLSVQTMVHCQVCMNSNSRLAWCHFWKKKKPYWLIDLLFSHYAGCWEDCKNLLCNFSFLLDTRSLNLWFLCLWSSAPWTYIWFLWREGAAGKNKMSCLLLRLQTISTFKVVRLTLYKRPWQILNCWWRDRDAGHGCLQLSSVQFSRSVVSDSLRPHGLQHARLPCPSPTPGAYSNSCLLSRWCHPTISSSVVPFSSRLQSFSASGSFPMSQFFTSGGQSTGVLASASVLPMNSQDWFPFGWTGWISLQSKGLSRVFSKPQFKSINSLAFSCLYSLTLTSIHDCWKNHSFD